MNRNYTRTAAALLVLGGLAACSGAKGDNDQVQTGSQGGRTAAASRAGAAEKSTSHKWTSLVSRHDRSVAGGTMLTVVNERELSSQSTHVGDRVVARVAEAVLSHTRDTVIPAGAEFIGRVIDIQPAPHPDQWGTLHVMFDSLRTGGAVVPVDAKVDSLHAIMRGRGVTTTDAAKVGAGAVVGGIAGRIIGGNSKGTIVGALAGGAAGGVIAHNTRTVDIVLPEGAAIHLELTRAFERPRAVASR